MGKKVTISYAPVRSWKAIAITTLISVLAIVGIYYLHPSNVLWYRSEKFSFYNLLQFVLVDQYIIELITTTILALAIAQYAKAFKVYTLRTSIKDIILYFLKFSPLYFSVYFISSPFSVGVRFLYHYYILGRTNINFFESYFFLNEGLYLSYLPSISISCSLLLTIAIIKAIGNHNKENSKEIFAAVPLSVKSTLGEKIISSSNISSITRSGRKYFVKFDSKRYQINKNLKTLQGELNENFIAINRSTIINLAFFKEYSFWENEKYIVRMVDDEEFNITRKRLKTLKNRLDYFHRHIKT